MNLNQVTLPCSDLERSVTFYRRLGFVQIVSSPPRYARFECPEGGATFSLHHAPAIAAESGVMVYFECSDVDTTCETLARQGVEFELAPTDQPWLWREAHLRDPDGNRICLYQAGENRRFPPWRIPSVD